MTFNTFLKITVLTSLLGAAVQAEIVATNLSGETLSLSLHGDGCSHFDGDRYDYPACAEQKIEANKTACFDTVFPGQELTGKEKLVTPQIKFGFFSFTYVCNLVDFVELHVCSLFKYLYENEQPNKVLNPSRIDLVGTGGLQMSVDETYHLTILPEWRISPSPKMDCKLARIQEIRTRCAKK